MSAPWAAIFPGQGSQHPGMGKDLFDNFKVAKMVFEEGSDSLKLDLKKLCFEGPDSDLKLTANTQPALLVTSVVAWQVFISESDKRPQVALGHSLGEYSALVAAEALSLSDALQTVRLRGLAMQDAVPTGTGGMIAVLGMEDASVMQACRDLQKKAAEVGGLKNCVLEVANFNSPGQVVVSGHQKALDYMKEHLVPADYGANRAKLIPLAVSAPFHCSLMKPAAERLKVQLEKIKWTQGKFDVIHNLTGEKNHLHQSQGHMLVDILYQQMTKPVLWTSSVKHAAVGRFIEFGAGKVLSGLVKKIQPESSLANVGTSEDLKNAI